MAETKYTKNDLRAKVADDLTLVPLGDQIPGEIATKIDQEIQNVLEMLEDERLLTFNAWANGNDEVIPARLMQPIAVLVALNVMPSQGLPNASGGDVMTTQLNRIRRQLANTTDDSPTEASYF